MSKVFLLQGPLFCLSKPPGFLGGSIFGIHPQHFLGFREDVLQQGLHLLHHLVDGPGLACVFLGLLPLELCPPPETLLAVKNAAPCIGHQLFRRLLIGQLLGRIVAHLGPDQLVNVLVAAALGQILQRMIL